MADFEEELRFAQQIKTDFCDMSGKEINPAKAAVIVHKIGVIYRKRSPHKVALLKSASLFNAATVRSPLNITQIQSDLVEISQYTLQEAKAKNQNVNLVKKAEQTKPLVENLRTETEAFLSISIPQMPVDPASNDFEYVMHKKILACRVISKSIADKYKEIMATISQFCENVMGQSPCEYATVEMGSLAREEITPYSDFEHIILLFDDDNYNSHLEFFLMNFSNFSCYCFKSSGNNNIKSECYQFKWQK